jgi:hypothetical protein
VDDELGSSMQTVTLPESLVTERLRFRASVVLRVEPEVLRVLLDRQPVGFILRQVAIHPLLDALSLRE